MILLKLLVGFFVIGLMIQVFKEHGIPQAMLIPVVIALYFIMRKKPSPKDIRRPILPLSPDGIYILDGVNDVLEVFEDKITLTAKKDAGSVLIRGLKGSKSIPYTSITAIQFRKADPINGYIQFSLMGAVESGGGVIAAISDENTCFFVEWNNDLAERIRDYIELRMREIRAPQIAQPATASISDEIKKLSELRGQGIVSDAEFEAAKKKLIG